MTFVAPGEEAFDEPPPAAESSRWPRGFRRQEAVAGPSGSHGMQARGVVGSAGAYPANPFAPPASARSAGARGVVEGAVLRAPMLANPPTNTASGRMGGPAEEPRREQGPSSSKGKGKQREQDPSVAIDAQMAGLLQRFYDVGMRIPDGISLDVFEDPVAQEAVVFLLERLERAEAMNVELQQRTDELQHRVFTQADALKKREVSPPQQQPQSKKAQSDRPARPAAGNTMSLPLPYTEMAAEDSLDPQPMMEEPAPVERQAPLRPRGYTHLPRMEVQWYVTGNMAIFADGVEVGFPENLPRRSGADVLPLGAPH
ncbi:hypothetical protein H0H92_009169, partial [Tricholoma furcatifolium]